MWKFISANVKVNVKKPQKIKKLVAETYNSLYEVPSNRLKAFDDYKNKQKYMK